jgi:hypothetical protein
MGLNWLVALVVVVATVIAGRPPPRADWLLIVGIPILVVGQVWGLALLSRQRALRNRPWLLRRKQLNPVTLLFGALSRPVRYGLAIVMVLGFAAGNRSAAGGLVFVFGFHFGVALNELARRHGRGIDLPPPIVAR